MCVSDSGPVQMPLCAEATIAAISNFKPSTRHIAEISIILPAQHKNYMSFYQNALEMYKGGKAKRPKSFMKLFDKGDKAQEKSPTPVDINGLQVYGKNPWTIDQAMIKLEDISIKSIPGIIHSSKDKQKVTNHH